MAAALRLDTPTTSTPEATTPATDRQQWWENVQFGVSAMLTDAARPASSHRLAG